MAKSFLREEIEVYSEKYDIHGMVRDYGIVTKLFFTHEGKEIVMGIQRGIPPHENLKELGQNIIETYVEHLASYAEGRKPQLHYWYIGERKVQGKMYLTGYGIVTGHKWWMDSTDIYTSVVEAIYIDEEEGELLLTTIDDVYHCPLEYCRFEKQDEHPELIPDYLSLKEKYKDKAEYPSIEPGKVLLVLADFSEYYFHSLYYLP